jgi:hypothetical protein
MTDYGKYQLVGFDLRLRPLLDLGGPKRLGEHWPTDFPKPMAHPATISPSFG